MAELLTYSQGVNIVGDGPTGLSAALFLAKNGMNVTVFGENETYMHDAYLYNYLGIDEIGGSNFIEIARDQCHQFGATIKHALVTEIGPRDDGYKLITQRDDHYGSKYVVLAEGDERQLARNLGVAFEETEGGDEVVQTDKNGRTSMDNVYAGGWTARNNKIQAAISVGDGAAIALDILSKEEGRQFHDFDVPE